LNESRWEATKAKHDFGLVYESQHSLAKVGRIIHPVDE
jgi:hypothetical protein